jgi:hypothetical protein
MSTEVVRLPLPPGPPPTPSEWYAVWQLAWSRVRRFRVKEVASLVDAFLHELLPDHEERVMFLEPNALVFGFPDFGGAFSRSIGPLSDWFAIALATEHRALRSALVGSRPVRISELPRLQAALAAPSRPLLRTRDRLFGVHRTDDALVLEALDDGAALEPSDDEHARALRMLELGTTEDPIRAAVTRPHFTEEREADEQKERRDELRRYVQRLASLEPAARLAHALADPEPVADVWLEREASALVTPEGLEPFVASHGVRVMGLVDRAYTKAKAAERHAWLPRVAEGLAHPDREVVRAALAVRLDDKHVVDDAMLSCLPLARIAEDAELAEALMPWLEVVLLRRAKKGSPTPDLTPLHAIAAHRSARARLRRVFFDDRWPKSTARAEVLAWYANVARDGFDDEELPALVLADPPPELAAEVVARLKRTPPTTPLVGAISCAWERELAISDALEEVLVAWAAVDDRWVVDLGATSSLAGARRRLCVAARALPETAERVQAFVAFAVEVLGVALVRVRRPDALVLARETPMHAALATWLQRHPDADDRVRDRARGFLADAVAYARARFGAPELESELLGEMPR